MPKLFLMLGQSLEQSQSLLSAVLEKETPTFDVLAKNFDGSFKLSLETSVAKCRLAHLLNMTAGIPNYADKNPRYHLEPARRCF